jgi:hypothetical protein
MTNGRMHFDYCYTCCYTRSVQQLDPGSGGLLLSCYSWLGGYLGRAAWIRCSLMIT